MQADISDQAQGQRLVDQAVERFGQPRHPGEQRRLDAVVPHDDLDALTDEICRGPSR